MVGKLAIPNKLLNTIEVAGPNKLVTLTKAAIQVKIQIPASGPIKPVTMTVTAIRIKPATPKKAAQSNQIIDPDQGRSPSED